MAAPPPPNGSTPRRPQWPGAVPPPPATNGFRPQAVPVPGVPRGPAAPAVPLAPRGGAPLPSRSPMAAPMGAPQPPRASPRPPAQRPPLPPGASPRPPGNPALSGALPPAPRVPAANGVHSAGPSPVPPAPTTATTAATRRRAYPTPAAISGGLPPAPAIAPMQPQPPGFPMAGAPSAPGYGTPALGQPELFTPGAPDMPSVVPSHAVNEAAAYGVVPAPAADFVGGDPNGLAQQMGGLRLASNHAPAPMPPASMGMGMGMGMGGAPDPHAMMGPQGSVLSTVNLSGMPPDPYASDARPPPPKLPPGANMTMSPLANADPAWQRCTLAAIPTTASLLAKTNIPLGLVLTPNRSVPPPGMVDGVPPVDQVPLVDEPIIVRCRKCRTYINPFVQFTDNGNRWKCAICGVGNEVPSTFDWDHETNQPRDRWSRPELNSSVVEFIAPREYMVRSPQAPTYVFLIDVTANSVRNGMVAQAAKTILDSLDEIPNADGRTRVGFIAVDSALHVFTVAEGNPEPEILVVSDMDDPFLPKPTDILMNLAGARAGIEALLKGFPDMFAATSQVASGMGSALQTAFQLTSPTGGKIVTLTSTLPAIGIGALKVRDDPKLLGTSKESSLLQAGAQFYKTFPIDCARAQVSVDMWLFSSSYTDVASLACLPRYTGGETFFYPGFNGANAEEGTKFHTELNKVLRSPIGLEAILRVRTSRGIRPSAFHGNFFVRSSDLLAMSAVPLDQNYAVELEIEENITTPIVLFQAVLLHSTSFGERRIRVINLALPTTTNLSEVYASADQQAITMLLANKSVERAISYRLEDARDAVFNKLVDIFVGYKQAITGSAGGISAALNMCHNLALLPLLLLALLKTPALKESAQLPPDLRAYAQALLTTLPSERVLPYLVPNFYSLHNMPPAAGTWTAAEVSEDAAAAEAAAGASSSPNQSQCFVLPPRLNLTSEKFERHGLYLLEDGLNMFLWLGRDAVPQLMIDVFGVDNQADVPAGKTLLPALDNKMNMRVRALVDYIRVSRKGPFYPTLYVVKEGGDPALRQWALSQLVEDRDPGPAGTSYAQFLNKLRERVNVAK